MWHWEAEKGSSMQAVAKGAGSAREEAQPASACAGRAARARVCAAGAVWCAVPACVCGGEVS